MNTQNRKTSITKISLAATIGMGLGISLALPGLALTPVSGTGRLVPLDPAPALPPATSTRPNFAFTNVLEYSDCLAAILDGYLNTDSSLPTRQNLCQDTIYQTAGHDGLSQAEALELVSAADFYSTHFLSRAVYPPKGLRLRIAENLGFIYEIDQHDPEVLQRAVR